MIISVVNHAHRLLRDEQILPVLRAINRQIAEDFSPYWSRGAKLRLETRLERRPSRTEAPELRGDAILHLWDEANVDDALGYHEENHRGVPYGFVFTKLCDELKESWTVTLSHEVLELVNDAEVNLLVSGPHPEEKREVFHWYEMCDAVQGESYEIDGVAVSNFVLPSYFTRGKHGAARCDFLGRSHAGKTLRPFGLNPAGYIGFFDPKKNDHVTYTADAEAARRLEVKAKLRSLTRRSRRGQSAEHGDAAEAEAGPGLHLKEKLKSLAHRAGHSHSDED